MYWYYSFILAVGLERLVELVVARATRHGQRPRAAGSSAAVITR